MILKFIKNFFFIKIIKNYNYYKKRDKKFVLNLEKKFVFTQYEYSSKFLKKILNNANINFSISFNQLIFEKLFSRFRLYRLYNLNKKIIFPIPTELINRIKQDHEINIFFSKLFFYTYCFVFSLKSIIFFLKYFLVQIFLYKKDRSVDIYNKIFFCNVIEANVSNNIDDDTFVSWYIKKTKQRKKNIFLVNSKLNKKKLDFLKESSILPNIGFGFELINLFTKFFILYLYNFKEFLFGRPIFLLATEELLKALIFSVVKKRAICNEYVFLNRTYIYRPLWTYIAEERKSKIILAFFSTNQGIYIKGNSWTNISWPRFYVWDDIQIKFLKEYNRIEADYFKFDYIPSIDDNHKDQIPVADLCVFDDPPLSSIHDALFGQTDPIYNFRNCNKFLDDIVDIASSLNLTVNFKLKRNYKSIHSGYLKKIDKIKYSKFSFINPNISPKRLIEKSKITISFPFSTTALIAKNFGQENIYYSPLEIDNIYKICTRRIEIIANKSKLKEFIINKLNLDKN